ncbi:MAG: TIGR02556 family CRISPR-associated protein [Caldisericia bacterium]
MLEAIRSFGEAVSKNSQENFVFNLIQEDIVPNKSKLLLVLNFNLKKGLIETKLLELVDNKNTINLDLLKDYLWVGNSKGNIPQDRLTTNKIEYLIFQTIINLYKGLKDSNFKNKLKEILDKFYIKEDNLTFLDISKIEDSDIDSNLVRNLIKTDKKEFEEKFFEILKNKHLDFKKNDIGLYSIEIDEVKPKDIDEYVNYLKEKLIEEPFLDDSFNGICHVCGKKDIVTSDTTKLPDKYYITKLIIFASNLDKKNFFKNFSICKECYEKITIGSVTLKNRLNFRIFNSTVYLIPSLIFANEAFKKILPKLIEPVNLDFKSILRFDDFLKFEKEKEKILEDFNEYMDNKNYININLLFYEKDNQSFKIQKLIKDIPSRRIDELRKAQKYINSLGQNLFSNENNRWVLTFDRVYNFLPIRVDKKNRSIGIRKILDFYESIFLGNKINKDFLIKEFVELISVYKFERFNITQIRRPKNIDIEMISSILQTNLFLKMLKILNLIDGGDVMEKKIDDLALSDEIKNYFKEMEFNEEKAALFLLGYLIGDIGRAQMTQESKKKPILEKINFRGMNLNRILILTNEVFEKLDQYKIRHFNEINFSVMKMLFDKRIKNWSLSDIENVYYIMSGYAFNTNKVLTHKKEEVKNE